LLMVLTALPTDMALPTRRQSGPILRQTAVLQPVCCPDVLHSMLRPEEYIEGPEAVSLCILPAIRSGGMELLLLCVISLPGTVARSHATVEHCMVPLLFTHGKAPPIGARVP